MGVETLDKESRLGNGGKPLFPLDFADLGFDACPFRNERVQGDIGEEILLVGQMGSVNCDGSNAGLEYGRHLNLRRGQVLVILDSVMVRMDGNRYGNAEFVAECINNTGHVPVIDSAVCLLPSFRLCNLDDNSGLRPLSSHEGATDNKIVPPVAGHGNRLPFGEHCPVYYLAAHDKRLGIGEKLPYVRGTKLKGLLKISRIDHNVTLLFEKK